MTAMVDLIIVVIDIYKWILIAMAVMSWLISFDVVNRRNRLVYSIADFLNRVTEPALRPIRRVLPNLGGIDISPVILFLILWFIERLIITNRM